MPANLVLVVDDEKNIRRTLQMVLEGDGHEVLEAATFADAVDQLSAHPVDCAIFDVKLGADSGLALLERLAHGQIPNADPTTPVIVISGHATIEEAVRATRTGAFDFLEKPLDRDRVVVTLRNALERRRMSREVANLRSAAATRFAMVGRAPVMEELFRQIAKVAPTRGRVLITGESGTGKELIARAGDEDAAARR